MFPSRIDVIGLVADPGPSLLGWNRDLLCWTGTRTSTAWLDSNCLAGTGESDRCDRTLLGSGTGTYVSESDRCDRTRSGSGTFSAWLEPGPRQLGWNRDLLHRNWTSWRMTHRRPTKNRDPDLTAWLEPGPSSQELDFVADDTPPTHKEPRSWLDCLAGTGTFFTGTGLRGGWHTADPRRTEILTWLLGWNRDLLHRNWTSWRMTHRRPTKNRDPDLTAWLEPGPSLLGWNRSSKGRMRSFVGTSGKWFP